MYNQLLQWSSSSLLVILLRRKWTSHSNFPWMECVRLIFFIWCKDEPEISKLQKHPNSRGNSIYSSWHKGANFPVLSQASDIAMARSIGIKGLKFLLRASQCLIQQRTKDSMAQYPLYPPSFLRSLLPYIRIFSLNLSIIDLWVCLWPGLGGADCNC